MDPPKIPQRPLKRDASASPGPEKASESPKIPNRPVRRSTKSESTELATEHQNDSLHNANIVPTASETPMVPKRPSHKSKSPELDSGTEKTSTSLTGTLQSTPEMPEIPPHPCLDPEPRGSLDSRDSPVLAKCNLLDKDIVKELPKRGSPDSNFIVVSSDSENSACVIPDELPDDNVYNQALESAENLARDNDSIPVGSHMKKDFVPHEKVMLHPNDVDTEDDGNKTPSNTEPKVTMKTEDEESSASSTFDDDLETVQDEATFENHQEPDVPEETNEASANLSEKTEINEPIVPKETGETSATTSLENPENDESVALEKAKASEISPNLSEKTDINEPIVPKETGETSATTSLENPENDESVALEKAKASETSSNLSEKTEINEPIVPKETGETSASLSEKTGIDQASSDESSNKQAVINETGKGTQEEQIPSDLDHPNSIPSTVVKDVKQPPVIPKRPTVSKNNSHEVAGAKSKVPPPKPKKLSSKIAAFQEMFNRQQPISNSDGNTAKEGESSEPVVPKRPAKLSTERTAFASKIQGMMGRGIAMPGMVDPSLIHKTASNENDYGSEQESSSAEKVSDVRKGRAKGPRGKRLPKAIQDAPKVQQESRFNIVVQDLWEINIERSSIDAETNSEKATDIESKNESFEEVTSEEAKENLEVSQLEPTMKTDEKSPQTDAAMQAPEAATTMGETNNSNQDADTSTIESKSKYDSKSESETFPITETNHSKSQSSLTSLVDATEESLESLKASTKFSEFATLDKKKSDIVSDVDDDV